MTDRFHTVVFDAKLNEELLLGPINTSVHVVFPHTNWALHMINCDPRSIGSQQISNRRAEPCTCPDEQTIHASDFMKLTHVERYGMTWNDTYSTNGYTPRPVEPTVKVDWSGERQPVLTRAERTALQKGLGDGM